MCLVGMCGMDTSPRRVRSETVDGPCCFAVFYLVRTATSWVRRQGIEFDPSLDSATTTPHHPETTKVKHVAVHAA